MKKLAFLSFAGFLLVLLLTSAKPIHRFELLPIPENYVPVTVPVDGRFFNPQKFFDKQCTFCHNTTGKTAPNISDVKTAYLKAYPKKEVFVEKMTRFIINPTSKNRLIKENKGKYKVMPSGMFYDVQKIKKVAEYIYDHIEIPKADKKEIALIKKNVDKHVDVKIRLEKGVNLCDIIKLTSVDFEFAKSTVNVEMSEQLDKLVRFLKNNPQIKIEIRNHTDARGSTKHNLSLSKKRANAIKNYLIQHGILSTRVIAKGYGESQLLNHCKDGVDCTEEQHKQNRRTEIIIQ